MATGATITSATSSHMYSDHGDYDKETSLSLAEQIYSDA